MARKTWGKETENAYYKNFKDIFLFNHNIIITPYKITRI